jgi:tetratricopeptide (TPR) repeat protein
MPAAIDPTAIKELLASTDIAKLETAVRSYEDDIKTESTEEEQQSLKLRILLWNRIQALQKEAGVSLQESLQNIGKLWFRMGETDKAVGQLTKAMALDPADAVSVELLGEAHAELSHYEKAIELHETAIGIWEKGSNKQATALSYSKLGNTYFVKGDFALSLTMFKKAEGIMNEGSLGGTEQEGIILGQMGMLLERTGEYEQAVEVLKRAHKVLVITRGETDGKTEEVGYLLEMTSTFVE